MFNKTEKKTIVDAITEAELNTSGEIRIHIDKKCKNNPIDKAVKIFEKLGEGCEKCPEKPFGGGVLACVNLQIETTFLRMIQNNNTKIFNPMVFYSFVLFFF